MRVLHDPTQWRQPEGITIRLPPHVNRPKLTFEEELRRAMSESIDELNRKVDRYGRVPELW